MIFKHLKFNHQKYKNKMAQQVKNLPAMQETQETWVQSLGQEDPLENEMAPHSSILAWKILWTEEPGGLQANVSQRIRHDWETKHVYIYIGMCVYIYNFEITRGKVQQNERMTDFK